MTLQAFWLILDENHGKRLECHTFLAKKHEKSVTLQAFLHSLGENHGNNLECHTFLASITLFLQII